MILDVRLDTTLGSELLSTELALVLFDFYVNSLVDGQFTSSSKPFLTLLNIME